MKANNAVLKFIDAAIVALSFLFFATLTNSIFLNEVGYFGALFFLLLRFAVTKENPFRKTDLEIYFAGFILIGVVSNAFSVYPQQAFQNFLKRLLLIPTLYFVYSVSSNNNKGISYLKVFAIFSLLTSLIYLWKSYFFYLDGMYQLRASGPSIFHNQITTSELFSFSAILFLAFVLDKNLSKKERSFALVGFLITLFSLIATMKRTGWVGFAAGVLVLLVLRKKYFVILFFAIALLVFAFFERSVSQVVFVKQGQNKLEVAQTIDTQGQVSDLYSVQDTLFVADYDNGLLQITKGKVKSFRKFGKPIIGFEKWRENIFVAELVDTKFLLLQRNDDSLIVKNSFYSPGFTKDFKAVKNYFYILDIDSGLTVLKNPEDVSEQVRFPNIAGFKRILKFRNFVGFFLKEKGVQVFSIKNGLPDKKVIDLAEETKPAFAFALGDTLLLQYNHKFAFVDLQNSNHPIQLKSEGKNSPYFFGAVRTQKKIYLFAYGGDVYSMPSKISEPLKIKHEFRLSFTPLTFVKVGNSLAVVNLKRNRLLSIFDVYMHSNATRLALWKAGVRIFLHNPIIGVGDVDLAKLYQQYKDKSNKEVLGHLHNNYFQFLAIYGILGFIVLILLFAKIFTSLWEMVKTSDEKSITHSFAAGALGVFTAFLTEGMFEWNFGDQEIITFVWFVMGMAFAFYYSQKSNVNKA